MCTPELARTIGLCVGVERERRESVYGPVALMITCWDVSCHLGQNGRTHLGFDVEFASGDVILDACACDEACGRVFAEGGDATVISGGCTCFNSCEDEGEVHAGVVVLA